MEKRSQILAGAYSFCLPGLGQVYGRRYFLGVSLTALFCILELYSQKGLGVIVPLMALGTALEAFLHTKLSDESRNKTRDYLFASIGVIGFFFWLLAFAPYVIPLPS